ncbi:MAG: hypothetical protein WCP59_15100 [Actinomycetota bacterium]
MPEHNADPSTLVAASAEEIVAAIATDAERIAVFRRRFLTALDDMGWLGIVGRDWVAIGDGGLEFNPLSFKQADSLLRDLEDISAAIVRHTATCDGQIELF